MNRVIKFRAWDKWNRKMWYTGEEGEEEATLAFFTHFDNKTGALKAILQAPSVMVTDDPFPMYDAPQEELPVMQFTGLQDKDGVDIYEGDIVRFNSNGGPCKLITFDAPDFMHGNSILSIALTFGNYPEVLGNKFENPELLKEE